MEERNQGYWHLRDCGRIKLTTSEFYECGTGGGNIITEDGWIYEDSGNDVLCNMGQATPEAIKEFTGPFDGEIDKEWDGGSFYSM